MSSTPVTTEVLKFRRCGGGLPGLDKPCDVAVQLGDVYVTD
jgi:hypothetical protein